MEFAFNNLVRDVMAAGKYAAARQNKVSRGIKKDGSILTKTDTELDKLITDKIKEYFPDAVIISEENPLPLQNTNSSEWIFTLDPIDGTDSYSQGMPGWCLAVGILNSSYEPVGAIVYAPRWGTAEEGGNLLTLCPGGEIKLNGKDLDISELDLSEKNLTRNQLMIGSGLHRFFDCSTYNSKLRVAGSAIINIIGTLIHSDVKGSLITPCYIWDITAAHALIKKAGLDMEYYSEGKIDYKALADRTKAPDHFISGTAETLELLRKKCVLK
ncbi:MAG: inositol monophosphatase [Spirochaetes bacterium]|nr:MAG: inositol monophosphatase [Spirochaetota bacterium]